MPTYLSMSSSSKDTVNREKTKTMAKGSWKQNMLGKRGNRISLEILRKEQKARKVSKKEVPQNKNCSGGWSSKFKSRPGNSLHGLVAETQALGALDGKQGYQRLTISSSRSAPAKITGLISWTATSTQVTRILRVLRPRQCLSKGQRVFLGRALGQKNRRNQGLTPGWRRWWSA